MYDTVGALSGYNPMSDPYFMMTQNMANPNYANYMTAIQNTNQPTFQGADLNSTYSPYSAAATSSADLYAQPQKKGKGGLILGGILTVGAGTLLIFGNRNKKKKGAETIWQGIKMIFKKNGDEVAGKVKNGVAGKKAEFKVFKNNDGNLVYTIPGRGHSVKSNEFAKYGIDNTVPKIGTEGAKLNKVEIKIGDEIFVRKGNSYWQKDATTGKLKKYTPEDSKIKELDSYIEKYVKGETGIKTDEGKDVAFSNCRYYFTDPNGTKIIKNGNIEQVITNNYLAGVDVNAYAHKNPQINKIITALEKNTAPEGTNISCLYKGNKGLNANNVNVETFVVIENGKIVGVKQGNNIYKEGHKIFESYQKQNKEFLENTLSSDKIAKLKFDNKNVSELVYTVK